MAPRIHFPGFLCGKQCLVRVSLRRGRGCASGFAGYRVLLVTQEVTLQDVSFDVPPPASGSCDSSLEVLQVTKKALPAALAAVVFIC